MYDSTSTVLRVRNIVNTCTVDTTNGSVTRLLAIWFRYYDRYGTIVPPLLEYLDTDLRGSTVEVTSGNPGLFAVDAAVGFFIYIY